VGDPDLASHQSLSKPFGLSFLNAPSNELKVSCQNFRILALLTLGAGELLYVGLYGVLQDVLQYLWTRLGAIGT
jgi:hypothetical protein